MFSKACFCFVVQKGEGPDVEETDDDEDDDDEIDDNYNRRPYLHKNYNIGSWSVRRMRSVVVITMLLMEMFLLYAFSKFDFAFSPSQLRKNLVFPCFWPPLYVLNFINSNVL